MPFKILLEPLGASATFQEAWSFVRPSSKWDGGLWKTLMAKDSKQGLFEGGLLLSVFGNHGFPR